MPGEKLFAGTVYPALQPPVAGPFVRVEMPCLHNGNALALRQSTSVNAAPAPVGMNEVISPLSHDGRQARQRVRGKFCPIVHDINTRTPLLAQACFPRTSLADGNPHSQSAVMKPLHEIEDMPLLAAMKCHRVHKQYARHHFTSFPDHGLPCGRLPVRITRDREPLTGDFEEAPYRPKSPPGFWERPRCARAGRP